MKFFRKMVIGISSIVFTAVALTSTTYAWFKINYQATVNHLQLRVTGGQGFKISIDDINYASDLKAEDIYNAMLIKYAPKSFAMHYDETLGKSVLCRIHEEAELDNLGNPIQIDDGNGNMIDKIVTIYDGQANQADINTALEGIELTPLTTNDGVNMEALDTIKSTVTSGKFIEFDVYFKTVNQTGYRKATIWDPDSLYYSWSDVANGYVLAQPTEENYTEFYTYQGNEIKYDILLNGNTDYIDPVSQKATSVSPTSFTSNSVPVTLSADLDTVINRSPVHLDRGQTIDVYSANAIRLSITDNKKYDSNTGEGVLVYELNDSVNASSNLGSYATIYSESYCEQNHVEGYSTDQEYIYNYSHSASYTYYSNLKGALSYEDSSLFAKLYDYKNGIPSKTIKFDDLLRDGNNNYSNNKVITTLSSDSDVATKLTFRIWLEGWDADCFDGIAGNINALLSFIAIPQN